MNSGPKMGYYGAAWSRFAAEAIMVAVSIVANQGPIITEPASMLFRNSKRYEVSTLDTGSRNRRYSSIFGTFSGLGHLAWIDEKRQDH